jgi:ATP/maltotriose-dependent transcriptional regulator MalT
VQQCHHALSDTQQHELLGIAHRQGEQLGRLLDQLLAAAAIDRGQGRQPRRSLVDAAALTEDAGRAARLAHPDHHIIIAVAGPLLVRVDPLAVSRILGNLLDTAAAYSKAGTTIRLSAGQDGGRALVAVLLDRLLEAFQQADLPRSRRGVALPGLVAALSAREVQVPELLAAGKSNPTIAEELVITLDTVKRHVTHILDKLGVANRTQAVTRARELGVLR